jgi:hypothetical protein
MGSEQRVVENYCRLEEPNQLMMRLFLEQLGKQGRKMDGSRGEWEGDEQ